MSFSRRQFHRFALASLGASLLPGTAAAAAVKGQHYQVIEPPLATDDPGKIEVLEFFSYGCPHCKTLSPLLAAWKAKLPADVAFRQIPVSFGRKAWADLARLYQALAVSGDHARLEEKIFRAIHDERANLGDDKAIIEWVGRQGIDSQRFADVYNSFGVRAKASQGDQMVARYRVTAVPQLFVDGRYAVTGPAIRGVNDMLSIVDELITQQRSLKKRG